MDAMPNILITFQATQESTEQLALALGLGAVQSGGNIRLRLLSPADTPALMHSGYGRLKAADLEWAQVVTLGMEAGQPVSDLDAIFAVLSQFPAAAVAEKVCYIYSVGAHPHLAAIRARIAASGLRMADAPTDEAGLTAAAMERIGNTLAASKSEDITITCKT